MNKYEITSLTEDMKGVKIMDRFQPGQIVYISDPTKLQYYREDVFGEHLAVELKRNLVFKHELTAKTVSKEMCNVYKRVGEMMEDD